MGDVCFFTAEGAGSPHPDLFPTNDTSQQHLAKWDGDISRASLWTVRSYQLRSAETVDLAQEARIRVLRVLHRNPIAPVRLIRRVISRAVRKEANRDSTQQLERLDSLAVDNDGEQAHAF